MMINFLKKKINFYIGVELRCICILEWIVVVNCKKILEFGY